MVKGIVRSSGVVVLASSEWKKHVPVYSRMSFLRFCGAWISGVCRPKFTKPGTRVQQPSVLKKFFSELQYSAAFGRESRKFAGGV